MSRTNVTLIPGDGIGKEVADATVRILDAAGCPINWERCDAGAEVFKRGDPTGVPRETADSIARNRLALKGPLETPVGFGEKSANVTLRKMFELYGNIRPTRDLPGIDTLFPGRTIDLVVVRENVEDLYAGIEHMQTPGVAQGIKLITRKGCEKICRLAFEIAHAEHRPKVHCATKANILKLTEGFMKRVFEDVAKDYPEIKAEHIIVDNCAHQLVRKPEQFGVIVTTNMNGDIISDLTSGLTGGLGLAPSANIGNGAAVFEAVHGSAPDIAGKDMANPTAMLLSAVMMLRHTLMFDQASAIEHALLITLDEGKSLTGDIARKGAKPAGTRAFTDAVIANLGKRFERWQTRAHRPYRLPEVSAEPTLVHAKSRRVAGIDLFIEFSGGPMDLGPSLERLAKGAALKLKMISNRGTQVYPAPTSGARSTDCVDCYRCRFIPKTAGANVTDAEIFDLLQRISGKHTWMHIEKLNEFDGVAGYTRAQGES